MAAVMSRPKRRFISLARMTIFRVSETIKRGGLSSAGVYCWSWAYAAFRFAKKSSAGVVVIDSCSHEHDGPGGLLEQHEAELTRMA